MATMVIFDEGAIPQHVTGVFTRIDPSPYRNRTDILINPDLTGLVVMDENDNIESFIVPQRDWKHDAGAIVEWTQAEKDARSAQEAAAAAQAALDAIAQTRVDAIGNMENWNEVALVLRAIADVVKDEINILRALHVLGPRTLPQLRAAIVARINSGLVDV